MYEAMAISLFNAAQVLMGVATYPIPPPTFVEEKTRFEKGNSIVPEKKGALSQTDPLAYL